MFKVLTKRATIPLVTVRLLLSPPACGTVEGLTGQRHVQASSSSLSSLKRQLKTALFARSFAGIRQPQFAIFELRSRPFNCTCVQCPRPLPTLRNLHHARLIIILLIILISYQIRERWVDKNVYPRLLLQSRSRELWVRQLVIQYYRRRRFLQYNFMDPGWGGGRISYGGAGPLVPPPLAPALIEMTFNVTQGHW